MEDCRGEFSPRPRRRQSLNITSARPLCSIPRRSEGVENESVEQVCFADKILLNKTDLADEKTLVKIEVRI